MKPREKAAGRKATAWILALAMLLSLIPASASYADASYGFQPETADSASNT